MAMNPKDLLVWIKSLSRGQALPLDASEIHESFEDAQEYANTAIAYGGQTVKVKRGDGKYHEYILQPSEDGYRLEEIIGGAFFVPGNALELTDDGTLNVKTTDEAETDNTLPITSSGVYTIVGNIGAILDTI